MEKNDTIISDQNFALNEKSQVTIYRENLDSFHHDYMSLVARMMIPLTSGNIVKDLLSIKRERVNVGPYPNVSFFESANRICSDLTLLHGCKELFKRHPNITRLECSLGTLKGSDIVAHGQQEESPLFNAEVFCTSEKFFKAKFYKEKHKNCVIIYNKIVSQEIQRFISNNTSHEFISVDITSDWTN